MRNQAGVYRPMTLSLSWDGRALSYCSLPGLPEWDELTPAQALLARLADLPAGGKALFLGCGHGAAAAILAGRFASCALWLHDDLYPALACARQTLALNQVENAQLLEDIAWLPAHLDFFDVVLLSIPKGRRMGRRWLLQAFLALKPGGVLYLCGANDQGIQSLAQDAVELFANPGRVAAYKKGSRLLHFRKGETPAENEIASSTTRSRNDRASSLPAWAQEPGVAPGSWFEFEAALGPRTYRLRTLPGVFAYDHIDEGTRLLLDNLPELAGLDVLDVGCGCGILGLEALARGAASVDLLDASLQAVASAQENLKLNPSPAPPALDTHLDQPYRRQPPARALASDLLQNAGQHYGCILSNPPFHTGKETNYAITAALIDQAAQVLPRRGRLVLVANRFLRYERLMQEHFTTVKIVAETSRFHVLAGML